MDTSNQYAYIVPDEGYKGAFNQKNIGHYSFVDNAPDADIAKLKKQGKATVGEIIDHPILDDLPKLKDVKIILTNKLKQNGEEVQGLYESKNNTITLKIQDIDEMRKTLNHEIQHAIDKETGTLMSGSNKATHDSRPQEQQAVVNDILIRVEEKIKGGATHEEIIDYLNARSQVKNPATKAQYDMAKKLYQKWYDSRSEIV